MTKVGIHHAYHSFLNCPTEHQRARVQNLAKLALWVHEHAAEIRSTFRMMSFMITPTEYGSTYHGTLQRLGLKTDYKCGTCACYAGHGPMAGIGVDRLGQYRLLNPIDPEEGQDALAPDWQAYTREYFTGGDTGVFDYLFGQGRPDDTWCAVDRTIRFLQGYPYEALNYMTPEPVDVEFLEDIIAGNFELCPTEKSSHGTSSAVSHQVW